MPAIRYLVPYQIDVYMTEDGTNQSIQNAFYMKSGLQVDTPAPAYGQAVAGASSTATLLTNFQAAWTTFVMATLSTHCTYLGARIRAIVGWRYPTPFRAITNIIPGAPVTLITATPHGLSNTMTIAVNGVTTPTGVNGTWLINVTGPNSVELLGSTAAGAYTGSGFLQQIRGDLSFYYEDNDELSSSTPGLVVGDQLPAYVSADVRRVNSGTGREFRSRIGLGTLSEASQAGGVLLAGTVVNINAAMSNLVQLANGGSDSQSGQSFQYAVSKSKSFMQPTPFTSSFTWSAPVSSFQTRANTGSQNSRKARS